MSETPDSPSAQQPAAAPQQVVVMQKRGNGMAVAGFVTGLLALIFAVTILLFVLAYPLGIPGLIFSAIGLRRANADPTRGGKGLAIAGLVLSIIALILAVLFNIAIADAID